MGFYVVIGSDTSGESVGTTQAVAAMTAASASPAECFGEAAPVLVVPTFISATVSVGIICGIHGCRWPLLFLTATAALHRCACQNVRGSSHVWHMAFSFSASVLSHLGPNNTWQLVQMCFVYLGWRRDVAVLVACAMDCYVFLHFILWCLSLMCMLCVCWVLSKLLCRNVVEGAV